MSNVIDIRKARSRLSSDCLVELAVVAGDVHIGIVSEVEGIEHVLVLSAEQARSMAETLNEMAEDIEHE